MKVSIGTASAGPGEISHGKIHVTTTIGGFDVYIPVVILNGVEKGPKLIVSGGVHGNEILGSVAIAKLMKRLDPKKIKGTLMLVPVTNISSFQNPVGHREGTRHSLWDGQILNRVDPKKDGSVTEQVWYAFRELIAKSDYHVDIHSGGLSYVYYTAYRLPGPDDDPELFKKLKEIALAFGVDQVLCRTPPWGRAPDAKGRERILVEIGGGDWFRADEFVETNIRGVTNIMKYLGMLDGKIEPTAEVAKIYDAHWQVASTKGGFYDRTVKHGDEVREGQVVGIIYDPFTGEEIEKMRAPVDGVVINTGTMFKYAARASMVFGKVVETINLNEYFK